MFLLRKVHSIIGQSHFLTVPDLKKLIHKKHENVDMLINLVIVIMK